MSTSLVVAPPAVKVGGKPYFVRFSNGAFYLLSTWGIDAHRVAATLNEYFSQGRYVEAMAKLCAASLGTFDAEGNWRTAGMTPLEMSDRLLEGEQGPLEEVVWKEFSGKLGLVVTPVKSAPAEVSPNTNGSTSGPSEPVAQYLP